ncbi:MAG: insulinase family protein, partial [Pseudomonadota bacterium]
MKPLSRIVGAFGFFLLAVMHHNAHAIEIREVESSSGVKALLVEDYTLPLISFAYRFGGGTLQDPEGKAGTVRMMAALIDEGAGELDGISFRAKLEKLGIEFGFSNSNDFLAGRLRMLRSDRETGFGMLKLALTQPRFDDEDIERIRDAMRTGIIRSKTNPGSVAAVALRETLFGEHPY